MEAIINIVQPLLQLGYSISRIFHIFLSLNIISYLKIMIPAVMPNMPKFSL